MRASKPTIKILVAKILPMNLPNCAKCGQHVVALDGMIANWVNSKNTSENPIVAVDAWTGFDTATMTVDEMHPNDAGKKKLADTRFDPLANAITG
jgi:hypothetical protein